MRRWEIVTIFDVVNNVPSINIFSANVSIRKLRSFLKLLTFSLKMIPLSVLKYMSHRADVLITIYLTGLSLPHLLLLFQCNVYNKQSMFSPREAGPEGLSVLVDVSTGTGEVTRLIEVLSEINPSNAISSVTTVTAVNETF